MFKEIPNDIFHDIFTMKEVELKISLLLIIQGCDSDFVINCIKKVRKKNEEEILFKASQMASKKD